MSLPSAAIPTSECIECFTRCLLGPITVKPVRPEVLQASSPEVVVSAAMHYIFFFNLDIFSRVVNEFGSTHYLNLILIAYNCSKFTSCLY